MNTDIRRVKKSGNNSLMRLITFLLERVFKIFNNG